MRAPKNQTRLWATAAVVALLATVAVVTVGTSDRAQADDAVGGDGTSSATAGASCWGIKAQHTESVDGIYWLNTAFLARPQQFHCDMTTDGGGWVLVGRGRQGWSFNPLGQASPATVRDAVDGPSAFSPAALDAETIGALLNGTAMDALPDGIRLTRATNTAGTATQDYRLFPQFRDWSWSFPGGQLLNQITVDGAAYAGSNTKDTAASTYGQSTNALSGQQGTNRMWTTAWTQHDNQQGFAFGSGVSGGSNSASNHLWTSGSEGSPIPFTQVWLRPQIANDAAGFTPLPSEGLAPNPKAPVLKSKSETAPWGVVGMNHVDESPIEPWNTNVLTLETAGDRVYVGGRFTGVRNGPGGSEVAQQSLAAFDLDGNWIDSFRPDIDGRVWRVVTDDGKLLVGGDFTSVDGLPNTSGLVALDPTTGAVITSWKSNITKANGNRPLVRAIDVQDGTAFVGGSFNRVTAGNWNTIKTTNAVSLRTSDANPRGWRPRLSGSAVDIEATNDGRVLVAGWFNRINDDTNHGYFGITDAATGNPVAGIGQWQPSTNNAKYQQAVAQAGDTVMVGGSEHNFQLWDQNRTQMIDSNITKRGGDTQAIEVFDDTAYWGCHCGDFVYQGTNSFGSPSGFRSVEAINLVGSVDATTFAYDTRWYPSSLKGDGGEGIWAIDRDDRKCVWVGGDLSRGGYSGNAANDWLGGFARFCPSDTTVPTAPSDLQAATEGEGVTITWAPSTDDSGTVSYDIYRDDRVIATQWGTSFTDPSVTGTHRYTVRASDARGNQSAAPAPISVNGPAPQIATVVAFGSTGRYLDSGTDEGTAWRQTDFDDTTWLEGPGTFGWGVADLGSTMTERPKTAYVRTSFDLADPGEVEVLDLKVTAATGTMVYLNGVEVGRINMGTGLITAESPAAGYIWGSAERAIHTITVPADLLQAGTNVIGLELHSMTANAGRAFVDVEATTYGTGSDDTPPTAPVVTATPAPGSVTLDWTAATDETALGGYQIDRDGEPLALVGPMALTFVDGNVDTSEAHTYVVTAYDTNGNATPSASADVGSQLDTSVLAFGSDWSWTYPADGLGEGWTAVDFDDSGWALGPGQFGYGDSDESTVISTDPAPRPLTAYFRTTVEIADPAQFSAVLGELIRDDGAVIYVNGVEVTRENMPEGPITATTPAAAGIANRADEKAPVAITIGSDAFLPGTNTIAVEIHNANRWSGDLSFDLELLGQP